MGHFGIGAVAQSVRGRCLQGLCVEQWRPVPRRVQPLSKQMGRNLGLLGHLCGLHLFQHGPRVLVHVGDQD